MKSIFCLLAVMALGAPTGYAQPEEAHKCSEIAKIAALEEIRDIASNEIADGKRIEVPTKIEIGTARSAESTKLPKGVSEGVWVRYTISFGKDVRNNEQLFFFNDNCVRNKRAEMVEGKKVDEVLKHRSSGS